MEIANASNSASERNDVNTTERSDPALEFIPVPFINDTAVNQLGEFITISTNTKRSVSYNKDGYAYIGKYGDDGKLVYHLVQRVIAQMFIPNPLNLPIVLHLDNDLTNNAANNLVWASFSKRNFHKRDPRRGLSDDVVRSIKAEYKNNVRGASVRALAEKYNTTRNIVHGIVSNKTYKDVE